MLINCGSIISLLAVNAVPVAAITRDNPLNAQRVSPLLIRR